MSRFNFVAVGPPGAGKTVYLAVLQELISQGTLGKSITIRTSASDRSFLHSIYEQVADPEAEFPSATDPTKRLREFTIHIEIQKMVRRWFSSPELAIFSAMTLTYIDYAGEWVTEGHRQNADIYDEFQRHLDSAHAVLAFVDGLRIAELMEYRQEAIGYVRRELRPTIDLASSLGRPIVMVLTKWDLLRAKYTLDAVIERLLAHVPELSLAVSARSTRFLGHVAGGVWAVPVSATGDEIVRLSDDGHVVKSGAGSLRPVNVVVPLAAAIKDIARMALAEYRHVPIAKSATAVEAAFDAGSRTLDSAAIPIGTTGITIDLKAVVAFAGDAVSVLYRVSSWPVRWIVLRLRSRYRTILSEGIDGVRSDESAVIYLVHQMDRILASFEADDSYRAARIWSDGHEWNSI